MLSAANISSLPAAEASHSTLGLPPFNKYHQTMSPEPLSVDAKEIKTENAGYNQTNYASAERSLKDEKSDIATYPPTESSSSTYISSNKSTSPIRLPSLSLSGAPSLPTGKLFTLPPINSSNPSPRRSHSLLALPNPPSPLPRNENIVFTQPPPHHPYQYSYPMQSNQLYYPMYQTYEPQYVSHADPRFYQQHPLSHGVTDYRGSMIDSKIREPSKEKSNDGESASGEDKGSDASQVINAKDVVATEVQNFDGKVRKMYPCPTPGCNKTFTRRYNLQSHLMVHTGKKPYICPNCGTSFSRQHDLRRHIRSLHSEERPHHCEHCNLSFARSDALKRHLHSESKREGAGGVHTVSLKLNL